MFFLTLSSLAESLELCKPHNKAHDTVQAPTITCACIHVVDVCVVVRVVSRATSCSCDCFKMRVTSVGSSVQKLSGCVEMNHEISFGKVELVNK